MSDVAALKLEWISFSIVVFQVSARNSKICFSKERFNALSFSNRLCISTTVLASFAKLWKISELNFGEGCFDKSFVVCDSLV